eukprot:COSAG05_NODE_580_length_8553_cov_197.460934_9_plen_141_part_00
MMLGCPVTFSRSAPCFHAWRRGLTCTQIPYCAKLEFVSLRGNAKLGKEGKLALTAALEHPFTAPGCGQIEIISHSMHARTDSFGTRLAVPVSPSPCTKTISFFSNGLSLLQLQDCSQLTWRVVGCTTPVAYSISASDKEV